MVCRLWAVVPGVQLVKALYIDVINILHVFYGFPL
jgi:hypothetical protein